MQNYKSAVAALVIGALVIGGAGGYYLGLNKASALAAVATKNKIQELEANWLKVQGLDLQQGQQKVEVKLINGRIVTVGQDYLEIETSTVPTNPFADPLPAKRRITLAEGGKVLLVSLKSDKEIAGELAAFEAAQKKLLAESLSGKITEPLIIPSSEKLTEIAIKDLQANTNIQVVASQDIEYAETIKAVEIRVAAAALEEIIAPPSAPPAAPVEEKVP
ncbi:MAG: hypothetical protein WCT10_00555 [Patescibacteria group bacterium]